MQNVTRVLQVSQVLRVLLVESADADASRIERALAETGFAYSLQRVRSERDFASCLAHDFDIVLAEWEFPDCPGLGLVELMRTRGAEAPLILLSRSISDEEGIAAVRRGAVDHLSKDGLSRLKSAITGALEQKALRREANDARRALARTEDEFRNAFDHSPVGMAFVALDGHWLRVNEALCRMIGYGADELRSMVYSEIVHPADRMAQAKTFEQLLGGMPNATSEIRFLRKDGGVVWGHMTASMLRDSSGDALYQMVQLIDVTPRRQAEERFRSTWDQAPVGMAHMAVEGTILLANPELCRMLGRSEEGLLGRSLLAVIHEHDRARAAASLKRLLQRDVEAASEDLRCLDADGMPVWVSLSLSIVRDDTGIPQYCFAVVDGIGKRISAEERFRATFNQAAVGILHTSPHGPIIHVNQRIAEMLGYTEAELLAKTVNEVTFPDDRGTDRAHRLQLLAGEITHYNSERRLVRKDGSVLWAGWTVSAAREASSGEVYLIQVIQDISERKRVEQSRRMAEARLERARRARRVLGECSRAVVHALDEAQLLHEMCRIVVESGGYVQSWIGFAVHDERKSIRMGASAGYEEGFFETVHFSWGGGATERSTMGRVIATGEPYLARDIYTDPMSEHRRARARICGFQSTITFPLKIDGVCIGGLSIYAREPDAFDDEEISLLTTLAQDLAHGIASLRAAAERARTEAQLERVLRARRVMVECNHVLVHATNEPELLRYMCRIVVESGGYLQAWIGLATGNADRSVEAVAHAGFGDLRPMTNPSSWDAEGRYRGAMGEVIRSGKAAIARDIWNDPAYVRRRERALELGFQSSLIVPLVSSGDVLGALSIYAREAEAFDQEEISLLTELASDLAFGMAALRMRVAREAAEARSRFSEQRFREMFNQAAVGITCVDLNGALAEVNQKFCDMLGYARDELIGKAVKDITHPDDHGQGALMRRQLVEGVQQSWSNEKRFMRKDGGIVWGRRTMSLARGERGEPQYVIGVIEDITGRKALEQQFEATFNQAAVGIMHSSLDRRVLLVNQRLCEMLGYSAEEMSKIAVRSLHHPEDTDSDQHLERELLAGEIKTFAFDKRYIRKDGRVIWCRRTVSLARDADGRPQYFIRVFEDITDRKEAEERYRATVQQAPMGIIHTSLDGNILQINPKLCQILGYDERELLGMTTRDIVHPDDHGSERRGAMQDLLDGRIPSYTSDKRLLRKNGDVIWARRTVSVVRNSTGAPLYFIRLVEDITEQKETEERYRATVDHAPVGIMHTDANGKILHVNPKLCEMLGYEMSALVGRASLSLLPPAGRGAYAGRFTDLHEGRIASFVSERPLVRSDQSLIWTRRVVSLVRNSSGQAWYFLHMLEDITGSKEAEERYRATFDNAPVGMMHTAVEGNKILRVNPKLCEILGYSASELLAIDSSEVIHPEHRGADRANYHDKMLAGEMGSYSSERLYLRKGGVPVWTNRTVSLVRDSFGKPLYFIRILEDISERKAAQQALQRTAELNALLHSLATAANEAVTPEQAFRACLARLVEFSGWSLGRVMIFGETDAPRDQVSLWYGADDERWRPFREASEPFVLLSGRIGFIRRAFDTGQAVWLSEMPEDESLFRRAHAARACGLKSGLAFPVISGGKRYALIEFYSDRSLPADPGLTDLFPQVSAQLARVAERRAAENALLESERFARATMDALSQRICVVDDAGTITAVNKAWRQFAQENGYSADAIWQGENFFQVCDKATGMSGSQVAYIATGIRDVLTGVAEELATEYSCRTHAEQRWFAVKATRFPGPGPKRVVISYEDITERALSHRRRAMEHAVVSVLAESATLGEAIPKLLRMICEAMDWSYGARWAWDETARQLRRDECWSEKPLDLDPADARSWTALEDGENGGLLRRGLAQHEPTWIVDVQRDPTFHRRASAQKLGFVSAYAFPIIASGKIIGMMEFFGREARQPDEMLLLVTRSVGSQIGQYIQRKEAEEALRISEERFRITIGQASVGITVTSLDRRYLMVNQKYCEILGYTREELLARTVRDVVLPEEYDEAVSFRRKMIEGDERTLYRDKRLVRKDGSLVWTNLATSLVRGDNGEPKHFISVVQDISDKKHAEIALRESEEKFNQLSSNIPQVFWISDAALKETIYMSPACEQMLGLAKDELVKSTRNLVRLVHPEDRLRVYHARKSAASGQYDETYRIVRPDGSVRWIQDRAFPVRDANNAVYRIAGIAEDITHRKEAEEKLVYLAHYDGLTALPNRTLFLDRLRQTLAQARRRNKLIAIMFLDLDRFKITNDTLGHSAGDELLTQVAARLLDRVRVGDTVGRFGGDEFGLILSDLRTLEDARHVAQKIMSAFEQPFALERGEVYVSGSIGISMYPADSDDEGTLMKNADAAMYRAKEAGRNNFQFYTAEMNAQALRRLAMESSLRRALEREEFLLHYQPKVSLTTGRITGVEALLRWQRPGAEIVPPAEFVPLLEDSGLIVSIGEWLMDAACREIKAWEKAGIAPVPVAINLSARQFAAKDLAPTIQRVLSQHAIAPDLLQLEITESCLMGNTSDAVQLLTYLKSLGLHLSIDDFGTGYSSLAYLKRFPIDALKIDRSFVSDITTDLDDATIIRAVIGMAHSLGLKVVAEGVETDAQLAFLSANGCDEMQGYYYSHPLPAAACMAFLRRSPALRRARRRTAISRH